VERKWWTLIAVCVAIFMLLLDITVVNVALPSIQHALHSSFADLQWVVNAYALTLAAFLLTAGSLADLLGRRRVFGLGLVVFTCASVACGLSTTPLMLNLARAVQGVGGAMMFATSLALIAEAFHGRERGVAFGAFGAVTGAAVAIGPVVGGLITSGIGWEWIFFINAPIGVAAVVVTLTQVSESRDPNATGVDWAGLVTFSGALFLLVYALVQGNEKGWGSTRILTCLIAAAVLFALFVVAPRSPGRASSRSRSPPRSSRCSSTSRSTSRMSSVSTPCRPACASCPSPCSPSSSPRSPVVYRCVCPCGCCSAAA
jgi:MFS family permease